MKITKLIETILPNRWVDSSSLAVFRMAFGLILTWECLRYFHYGWIERYWIKPDFFFTYTGFSWLAPWSGDGMYIHFFFLGVLAIFILFGLFYRLSSILFFLGFTYIFLLDKANYLNHFYLISLISFLLILLPANRSYSLDALLWPQIKRNVVPLWSVWILRFQVGVAYFFGGIAKINEDWLRGEPMRTWLKDIESPASVAAVFHTEFMAYFISYGGLFFDLLIVPFLLWKKTRLPAFILALIFHLTNYNIFSIGIFPWLMMAMTTIYFEPDWAKKWLSHISRLAKFPATPSSTSPLISNSLIIRIFLTFFVLFQVLIPFRHILIAGNVHWTEEGHRFSWHMKLRDKSAKANFFVTDKTTGETWTINQKKYLSKRQRRKMAARPDMILQFAHYMEEKYKEKGYANISIHAEVKASLNARPRQDLINPSVDLTNISKHHVSATWIAPLRKNK